MVMRVKQPFWSTAVPGPAVFISRDDFLDPDDPHVKAFPDLFVEVKSTTGPVETATARPGEARNTRRS